MIMMMKLQQNLTKPLILGAVCLIIGSLMLPVGAIQLTEQTDGSGRSATLAVVEQPEVVVRVLESLLRSILYSTSADYQNTAQKRGLDLGISRGFSGSQAGKHLMGLSAASFANGPGRR